MNEEYYNTLARKIHQLAWKAENAEAGVVLIEACIAIRELLALRVADQEIIGGLILGDKYTAGQQAPEAK